MAGELSMVDFQQNGIKHRCKNMKSSTRSRNFMQVFLLLWLFGSSDSRGIFSLPNNRSEETRMVYGIPGDIYFFPWSCWVNTNQIIDDSESRRVRIWPAPIGMCSILTIKHVFVGVDNLRDISGRRDPYPVTWQNLWIFTGSDSPGDPSKPGTQKFQIQQLWISLGPHIESYSKYSFDKWGATDWNDKNIKWDVIGAALNIGLVEIQGKIVWTPYVRPMPLPSDSITDIQLETHRMVNYLDLHPHSRASCSIATYGPTRSMVFTQVSYVPREVCKSVYCSIDLGYCFRFPFQWFHVCFRAVAFTDPCKYDQGAALYCNWWNRSIFAILSQSDNCGIDGLPAVYTLMAAPLRLWAAVVLNFEDLALRLVPFGRNDDFSKHTLAPDVPTPTVYNYPA